MRWFLVRSEVTRHTEFQFFVEAETEAEARELIRDDPEGTRSMYEDVDVSVRAEPVRADEVDYDDPFAEVVRSTKKGDT